MKRLTHEPKEGIPEAEPRSKFNDVPYGSARIGESIGKENVFPYLSKSVPYSCGACRLVSPASHQAAQDCDPVIQRDLVGYSSSITSKLLQRM